MLTLTNVTLGYDSNPVLQHCNLQVEQQESCLILGQSGSGKTSLLYAIAGLMPILSGTIDIDGTIISQLSEAKRDQFRGHHIGIIFQTLHLVKSLSVTDNLMLASYLSDHPQQRQHAEKVLEQLGIGHCKNRLPDQLSQGQQQRVAIARALMHRPALLLADELTSSLDDVACESVITLLKSVAEETKATLLIATHDSRVKTHFRQQLVLKNQ